MTFFDKLFTSKNKFFRSDCNPSHSFSRSSDGCPRLELSPEHVRVVLFRECERRGRKLLFDSEAVEKIPVSCSGRIPTHSDVVEVSGTHAYKYKKPNKDVSSLGEMIFGSVAISTRGATCKIHSIPAPARLMFTTVMPTSVRCHPRSAKSSVPGSLVEHEAPTGGCASDSIIYRGVVPKEQGGGCGFLSPTGPRPLGLHRSTATSSLRALATGSGCCETRLNPCPPAVRTSCEDTLSRPHGCLESRLVLECCEDGLVRSAPASRRPSDSASCSFGSVRSFYSSFGSPCDSKSSNSSLNCSGGSLNSLRRRWNQSLAVSLDASSCDESDETPVRVRTKLGFALVLNISGPHQTELEKFILNNSLTLDSILERLREQLESAYNRLDTFVQLAHAAAEAAAVAVCEMLRGRLDPHPRWLRPPMPVSGRAAPGSSHDQFVAAFCGVLQAFDAKATNFFVSTLITAMLTHNLSWVASVAANFTDSDNRPDSQAVGGYNPLWAQYSELFGAVASPARSVKVVVADAKARPSLSDLLDVLVYFLRCATVLEHDFTEIPNLNRPNLVASMKMANSEKPAEDGLRIPSKLVEKGDEVWKDENFDSGVDCEMREAVLASTLGPEVAPKRCFDVLVTSAAVENIQPCRLKRELYPDLKLATDLELKTELNVEKHVKREDFWTRLFGKDSESLKLCDLVPPPVVETGKFVESFRASDRSRDCCNSLKSSCSKAKHVEDIAAADHHTVFQPKEAVDLGIGGSLYPSIESLARLENVRLQDLTSERDRTLFVEEVLQMAENRTKQPVRTNSIQRTKRCQANETEELKEEKSLDVTVPFLRRTKSSEVGAAGFVQEEMTVTNQFPREMSPETVVLLQRKRTESPEVIKTDDLSREVEQKSPTPDEGYDTLHGDSALATEKNVLFVLGGAEKLTSRVIVTKSSPIEPEAERPRRRRKCPTRSRTVNIPLVEGLKILHHRSRTMEDVAKECALLPDDPSEVPKVEPLVPKLSPEEELLLSVFEELPTLGSCKPVRSRVLPMCPVIGGVSPCLHPHHALQAVSRDADELEQEVRRDLAARAKAPLTEAVYVVADMQRWAVMVHSSQRTSLGAPRAVRTSASQLVADMLESFAHLHRLGFPADSCLDHLEQKLSEIYRKSQAVAELLMATDFCTVDLLTSSLHIAVNDVPLLLSVATTHTPEIADKYGVSFS